MAMPNEPKSLMEDSVAMASGRVAKSNTEFLREGYCLARYLVPSDDKKMVIFPFFRTQNDESISIKCMQYMEPLLSTACSENCPQTVVIFHL